MSIGAAVWQSDILQPTRWSAPTVTGKEVEAPPVWEESKQSHYAHTQSDWRPEPVTLEGDMVRIRPEALVVGEPEAFIYDGVPVMVIKQSDETVEFYYVPAE